MTTGVMGLPAVARGYLAGAALCAAALAAPALRPSAHTAWTTVALLAALYAFCELPARCRLLGRVLGGTVPMGAGSFFPVLLAAALLLPPAAAALTALPGALAARVEQRPAGPRRVWRAAQLAVAAWAASRTAELLGGPAALVPAHFPRILFVALAAAVVFSLVLTALDGGILLTAEGRPVRTAWRGLLGPSLAPHTVHGLAGLMMAVLWRSTYGPVAALFVLLPMYITCWVFAQYHRERAAHQATIRALVQAVDLKDTYTRGHSERVGRASVLIARELGMAEDRVEILRFAGILHDVGKLGVPTRVLRKDGPLTPEERRIIELHPEYGHEIVRGIGFLGEARAAILHHHERMDGSGYPYGLCGDGIPEYARVVAVADAFDAMTSTRSYSRARPVGTALAELRRCAGAQFDPRMVDALAGALDRHGWETAVTADEPPHAEAAVPAQAPAMADRGVAAPPQPAGRTPDGPAPDRPAPAALPRARATAAALPSPSPRPRAAGAGPADPPGTRTPGPAGAPLPAPADPPAATGALPRTPALAPPPRSGTRTPGPAGAPLPAPADPPAATGALPRTPDLAPPPRSGTPAHGPAGAAPAPADSPAGSSRAPASAPRRAGGR